MSSIIKYKFSDGDNVLCLYFEGVLDIETLKALMVLLKRFDRDNGVEYDKFADFTNLESMNVGFEELVPFTDNRILELNKTQTKIKAAGIVNSTTQFGIGKIFDALMSGINYETYLCKNINEAAESLGVESSLLELTDEFEIISI